MAVTHRARATSRWCTARRRRRPSGSRRPRPAEFRIAHGGVAFIRATDMANGEVRFSSADHINEVAMNRITKGIGAAGDILFSHKGTVGKLAMTRADAPPFVCSPQTTFWRAVDETRLDRRFLYAYMQSRLFEIQWQARKSETDMADYVSLTAQRTFEVPHTRHLRTACHRGCTGADRRAGLQPAPLRGNPPPACRETLS